MAMKIRISFACLCMLVLGGCPVKVALTLHNGTNDQILVTSAKHNVSLGPSQSVTILQDDFSFDRDADGVELLKITGRSGSKCYKIVFAGIGLEESALGEGSDKSANLVIGSDGHAYVIPKMQSAAAIAKNHKMLRAAPKLRTCNS